MSAGTTIRKHEGDPSRPDKGTWARVSPRFTRYPVIVCCPNGNISGLPHTIADDGTVTPSFVCAATDRGCTFHEFIRLEGWEASRAEA